MQDGDYSSCPGGAERHYDQSLWLTDGFGGGAGGDWGQRIGREYFMDLLGSENIHILLHELVRTPPSCICENRIYSRVLKLTVVN